jgi:hypothetical protein
VGSVLTNTIFVGSRIELTSTRFTVMLDAITRVSASAIDVAVDKRDPTELSLASIARCR